MNKRLLLALALPLAAALVGCSEETLPPNGPGPGPGPGTTGRVTMRLADAPAHYDNVNIVVTSVQVLQGATWVTVKSDSTTYDLMLLRDGVVATLADGNVAAGSYTAIRLRIGASSTVVASGIPYPLQLAGQGPDGYQVAGAFNVAAGDTAEVLLDFDIARSIHNGGPGLYTLQPVVRVVVDAGNTTGRLIGHLLPEGVDAFLYAIQGTDTVTATLPRPDGRFTIWPLPAGTYQVAVDVHGDHRDTVLTSGYVGVGQEGDFGDIPLSPE